MSTVLNCSISQLERVVKEAAHQAELKAWNYPQIQLQLGPLDEETWYVYDAGSDPSDSKNAPRILQI